MDELNPALAFLLYQPKSTEGFTQPQLLSAHWLSTDPGWKGEMVYASADETQNIWGHWILWQVPEEAEGSIETQLTSERHAEFHDKIEKVVLKGVFDGAELDDERIAQISVTPVLEVIAYELNDPQEGVKAGHAFYEEVLSTLNGIKSTLFLPEYGEQPKRALGLIAWETPGARKIISKKVEHVPSREALLQVAKPITPAVLLKPNSL